MGREIKRVPIDFVFPLDQSFADAAHEQHLAHCKKCRDDDEGEGCGFLWDDAVPKGNGWQLWQTVSDGPITPVFATADELIDWMCQPVPPEERPPYDLSAYPKMPADKGWRRETAEIFVKEVGRAPSFIGTSGGIVAGAEAAVQAVKNAKKARA